MKKRRRRNDLIQTYESRFLAYDDDDENRGQPQQPIERKKKLQKIERENKRPILNYSSM